VIVVGLLLVLLAGAAGLAVGVFGLGAELF
jgi:hypothetical protein